jgi:hypothetical protein
MSDKTYHPLVVMLLVVLMTACAPSPGAIQTAVAEAQTAMPTLTPTPTAIPTSLPVVLYSDDFSNSQSGWQQSDNQGIKWMYSGGQFVLSDAWGWLYTCANRNFSDAVLTVDVIHVSGDPGQTGSIINWRYHDSGYYSLMMYGDGSFVIYKVTSKVSQVDFQKIYEKTFNDAINTGQKINHIAISFNGENSDIYINDKYVTSIQDTTFASGDICLGAFAGDTIVSAVEVSYDNLVIYTIDSWTPPSNNK